MRAILRIQLYVFFKVEASCSAEIFEVERAVRVLTEFSTEWSRRSDGH